MLKKDMKIMEFLINESLTLLNSAEIFYDK